MVLHTHVLCTDSRCWTDVRLVEDVLLSSVLFCFFLPSSFDILIRYCFVYVVFTVYHNINTI